MSDATNEVHNALGTPPFHLQDFANVAAACDVISDWKHQSSQTSKTLLESFNKVCRCSSVESATTGYGSERSRLPGVKSVLASSPHASHPFGLFVNCDVGDRSTTLYVCFSNILKDNPRTDQRHCVHPTFWMGEEIPDNGLPETGLVLTRYLKPASDFPVSPFVHWLLADDLDDAKVSERSKVEDDFKEDKPVHDRQNERFLRVIFCGHSHGAAVAQLVTARVLSVLHESVLDQDQRKASAIAAVGCVVFRAPHIANSVFRSSRMGRKMKQHSVVFNPTSDDTLLCLSLIDSTRHYVDTYVPNNLNHPLNSEKKQIIDAALIKHQTEMHLFLEGYSGNPRDNSAFFKSIQATVHDTYANHHFDLLESLGCCFSYTEQQTFMTYKAQFDVHNITDVKSADMAHFHFRNDACLPCVLLDTREPLVATIARNLLPKPFSIVHSHHCCQWSAYNEKDKTSKNLVQVAIRGRNMGFVSRLDFKGSGIIVNPVSNNHRFVFHFHCPVSLEAKTTFTIDARFQFYLSDDMEEYKLRIKGPIRLVSDELSYSSFAQMDTFTLVKQAFIFSLFSPPQVKQKIVQELARLQYYFDNKGDKKVISSELQDFYKVIITNAPLMETMSTTSSLRQLKDSHAQLLKDPSVAKATAAMEFMATHATPEEKKRAIAHASAISVNFCNFTTAMDRFDSSHGETMGKLHEVLQDYETVISHYCKFIFSAALLTHLCIASFRLETLSNSEMFLRGLAFSGAVAISIALITAATMVSGGLAGAGVASLLVLGFGGGVKLLDILGRSETDYMEKLTRLCEVLGVPVENLPPCPYLLEKELRKKLSSLDIGNYDSLLACPPNKIKQLFKERIRSPVEISRVHRFLRDSWSMLALRRILMAKYCLGVCGPMKQGKGAFLGCLGFSTDEHRTDHTLDMTSYQWEDISNFHFFDFPGFNDQNPGRGGCFFQFQYLCCSYVFVCTVQELDSSTTKQTLITILNSGKPFLLCINKMDEFIAQWQSPDQTGRNTQGRKAWERAKPNSKPNLSLAFTREEIRSKVRHRLAYLGPEVNRIVFEEDASSGDKAINCVLTSFKQSAAFLYSDGGNLLTEIGCWDSDDIIKKWLVPTLIQHHSAIDILDQLNIRFPNSASSRVAPP